MTTPPIVTPASEKNSEKEQTASTSNTPTPTEPPPEYSEAFPADTKSSSRNSSGLRKGAVRRRRTSIGSRASVADDEDDDSISSRQGRTAMYGISDDLRMGLE